MNKNKPRFVIWDFPNKDYLYIPYSKLILWRGFSREKNVISILKLTEKWSDSIREEYLDLIYKLGRFKIGKKSVIESLKIRSNFSAWWFGLISEKSNFSKSIYINDLIKILAFRKWINKKKNLTLTLYSSNLPLSRCLKSYCKKNNIDFEFIRIKNKKKTYPSEDKKFLRRIFLSLPHFLSGFIWLIYKIVYNLPLIIMRLGKIEKNKNEFLFISYLFNMKNSNNNFLHSSYWGELPRKLINDKKYSNWIHLYVKDKFLNNPLKASSFIKKLNKNNTYQNHISLFSFLNLRVIFRVILDLLFLNLQIHKIKLHKNFPAYKGFQFWHFFKDDWFDSFIGKSAVDNLLYFSLFERVFKECDQNSKIVYLLENQGWEIGMLGVCRSFGLNQTIGFSHVVSRYWDLRNYYDLREFSNKKFLSLPRPRILAVNNKNDYFEFIKSGYPISDINLVEGLRHLYLRKNLIENLNFPKIKDSLIVLGDYENTNTQSQLSVLNKLPKNILNNLTIIYKPHPASSLNLENFESLSMEIREEPLSTLLPLADIAFCSSTTSSCLDAFSYGLKVIIYNDPNILNLSPLRNFKDVSFVIDSFELGDSINKFLSMNLETLPQKSIFELSEGLPLWENLLYKNDLI